LLAAANRLTIRATGQYETAAALPCNAWVLMHSAIKSPRKSAIITGRSRRVGWPYGAGQRMALEVLATVPWL